MKKKKLGKCSVLSCSKEATHEIKYSSGTIGEYCNTHYACRIKEKRIIEERK